MSQRQGLIGLLRRRPPDEAFRTPGFGTPPVEPSYQDLLQPLRSAPLRTRLRDGLQTAQRVENLRSSSRVREARESQMGQAKFTKDQAFYVDRSIAPFLSCQNCVYWTAPNRCVIVSETGGSGEIRPGGTSTLFNASTARIRAVQRAYGRGGDQKGMLPQNIRRRVMPLGRSIVYPEM